MLHNTLTPSLQKPLQPLFRSIFTVLLPAVSAITVSLNHSNSGNQSLQQVLRGNPQNIHAGYVRLEA